MSKRFGIKKVIGALAVALALALAPVATYGAGVDAGAVRADSFNAEGRGDTLALLGELESEDLVTGAVGAVDCPSAHLATLQTALPYVDPLTRAYVSRNGVYHYNSDCSGMLHYTEMSVAEARASGYKPCRNCVRNSSLPLAPSFHDVTADTSHREDITWLAFVGITEGYPDGTFRGMTPVYRQDMAAFLYRLSNYAGAHFDEGRDVAFRDVSDATPHADDIRWLAATGISEGWLMPDGTREFRGMNSVVRQDMAAFLYRLAGSPDYVPTSEEKTLFCDVDETTPHAKEIWWLASTGVSEGWLEEDGTRTFRGMSAVVRQDMAAFLHRMVEKGLVG